MTQTITLEEIKEVLKEAKKTVSDVYTKEEILADPIFGPIIQEKIQLERYRKKEEEEKKLNEEMDREIEESKNDISYIPDDFDNLESEQKKEEKKKGDDDKADFIPD